MTTLKALAPKGQLGASHMAYFNDAAATTISVGIAVSAPTTTPGYGVTFGGETSNVPNALIIVPGDASTTLRSQPAFNNAPSSGLVDKAAYSYQTSVGNLFSLVSVADKYAAVGSAAPAPYYGTSVQTSSSCPMHIDYVPEQFTPSSVPAHYLLESKPRAHASTVSFESNNDKTIVVESLIGPNGQAREGYDYKYTISWGDTFDATQPLMVQVTESKCCGPYEATDSIRFNAVPECSAMEYVGAKQFAVIAELTFLVTDDSIGYQVTPAAGGAFSKHYFQVLFKTRIVRPNANPLAADAEVTLGVGVAILPLNQAGAKAYVLGTEGINKLVTIKNPLFTTGTGDDVDAEILFDYGGLVQFACIGDIPMQTDALEVRWHPITSVPLAGQPLTLSAVNQGPTYSQFVVTKPEPLNLLVHHASILCKAKDAITGPGKVGQINAEASIYPDVVQTALTSSATTIDYLFAEFIKRKDVTRKTVDGSVADIMGQVHDGAVENDVVNAIIAVDDIVHMFEEFASEVNTHFTFVGKDADVSTFVPLHIVNVEYQNTKDGPLLCTNWGTQWITEELLKSIAAIKIPLADVGKVLQSVCAAISFSCRCGQSRCQNVLNGTPDASHMPHFNKCMACYNLMDSETVKKLVDAKTALVKAQCQLLLVQEKLAAFHKMPTEKTGEALLLEVFGFVSPLPAPASTWPVPFTSATAGYLRLNLVDAMAALDTILNPSDNVKNAIKDYKGTAFTPVISVSKKLADMAANAHLAWNKLPYVLTDYQFRVLGPATPELGWTVQVAYAPPAGPQSTVSRFPIDGVTPIADQRSPATYRYVGTTAIPVTVDVDCTTVKGTVENPSFAIRPRSLDAQRVVDEFAAKLRSTSGEASASLMSMLNLEPFFKNKAVDAVTKKPFEWIPSCPILLLLATAFNQRHNILAKFEGVEGSLTQNPCDDQIKPLPPLDPTDLPLGEAHAPLTAQELLASLDTKETIDPIAHGTVVHKLPVLIKAGGKFSGPPAKTAPVTELPKDEVTCCPEEKKEEDCPIQTVDYDSVHMRRALLLVQQALHSVARPVVVDRNPEDAYGPEDGGKVHEQRPLYTTFWSQDDVNALFMTDRTADNQNVFETYAFPTFFNTFHRKQYTLTTFTLAPTPVTLPPTPPSVEIAVADSEVTVTDEYELPPAIGTVISTSFAVDGTRTQVRVTAHPATPGFADTIHTEKAFGELSPDDKTIALSKLQTIAIHCLDTLLYIPLNSPLAFGIVFRWRRKTHNSRQFFLDKIDLTYDNRQFGTSRTTGAVLPAVIDATDSVPTEEDLCLGAKAEVEGDASFGVNLLLRSLRRAMVELKHKHPMLNDVDEIGLPARREDADAYGMIARQAADVAAVAAL